MGPFKSERDAFRFRNGDFQFTSEYAEQLSNWVRDSIESAAHIALLPFQKELDDFVWGLIKLVIPEDVKEKVLDYVLDKILEGLFEILLLPFTGEYGRCGGMAFAAYDFYQLDWPVDRRLGILPPQEGVLGDYLTARLFDSLRDNVGKFLDSIVVLHIYPWLSKAATQVLLGLLTGPIAAVVQAFIGESADFFKLGGPKEIGKRSAFQMRLLMDKLDYEAAWPIGLIYSDKRAPWDQHQVLAIGYTQIDEQSYNLTVWDNNDLDNHYNSFDRVLTLRFDADRLRVDGYTNSDVVGFFAEEYHPKIPPSQLHFI